MSAMKAIHDKLGRGGTVMFEMSPARVEKLERHVLLFQDRMPPDESPEALLAADRKLDDMLNDQDPPLRAAWHLAAKAYVSQELGFDFTAFDIRRHQPMPERESGMVEAIRQQLGPDDTPVVVVMGRIHLPELHKQLQADAHVIAIVLVDDHLHRPDQNDFDLSRHSYLMAHDDILRVRGSDEGERQPFGFAQFAHALQIVSR
jgi:hypothetical protein